MHFKLSSQIHTYIHTYINTFQIVKPSHGCVDLSLHEHTHTHAHVHAHTYTPPGCLGAVGVQDFPIILTVEVARNGRIKGVFSGLDSERHGGYTYIHMHTYTHAYACMQTYTCTQAVCTHMDL